jgi:hypothetical protein
VLLREFIEGAEVKREGEELMATGAARVLSVNVGAVREFEYNGRPAKSGIWKSLVAGRIAARGINLDRALLSEFLTVSARTSVPSGVSGVGGGRSDHQQRQKYLVLVLVRPGFSHKRAPIRQDAWKIRFG